MLHVVQNHWISLYIFKYLFSYATYLLQPKPPRAAIDLKMVVPKWSSNFLHLQYISQHLDSSSWFKVELLQTSTLILRLSVHWSCLTSLYTFTQWTPHTHVTVFPKIDAKFMNTPYYGLNLPKTICWQMVAFDINVDFISLYLIRKTCISREDTIQLQYFWNNATILIFLE